MAPSACVAGLRLLLRRIKLAGHLHRQLRQLPTEINLVFTWFASTRRFCANKKDWCGNNEQKSSITSCASYEQDSSNVCMKGQRSSNTSGTDGRNTSNSGQEVFIEYIQGLPHIIVPLPSKLEKCRFILKPVTHNIGDLIQMLKQEDLGIERVCLQTPGGVRIASVCSIDSILDEKFLLQINDKKYAVKPPPRQRVESEDVIRLWEVRTLVAQMYEALHVGEYNSFKQEELIGKIQDLKMEIAPLELEKEELGRRALRKTVIAKWIGLSLMGVQFGALARLTWWEYNWDIMEPVTYFVTYGTTMAMFAYYCTTKQEYEFDNAKDRIFLLSVHKNAKKKNFDIEQYNILKQQIADAEYDLRRLQDPVNMRLPGHITRLQGATPPGTDDGGDDENIETGNSCDKKPPTFRLPFRHPEN